MTGPHQGRPRATAGRPASEASAAVVMVHGRGATAESILTLAEEFDRPDLADLAYVAPQAPEFTWYPYSFLAPIERNEPHLSSALRTLEEVLVELQASGIPPERTVLLGFSQGACLSLEFAARNPRRYAGVFGLSGGLIGPPGTPRTYAGSLDDTPVFLGCSDVDSHIPLERVHESAEVFRRMGATVDERIYPRMGHTVNQDELTAVRAILSAPL